MYRRGSSLTMVLILMLAGCNSASTSGPVPTPAPTNISGDYTGTMTDSVAGAGAATVTLAQTGNTAGGTIAYAPASGAQNASVSLTINGSNAISGSMVIDYPNNGPTCTFGVSGTYDTSTNVLAGSYTAVTNCTGRSGTFSLTQQCTDTITTRIHRNRVGGIAPC